jgi:SAM-dependent methyltransferase
VLKKSAGFLCPFCPDVKCAPCFSARGKRAAADLTFHFLKCSSCGSVFRQESDELISGIPDLYEGTYYRTLEELPRFERSWIQWCYDLRLSKVRELGMSGSWLDVGFGSATWLSIVQKAGFTVSGIDPSPEACAHARKRGLVNIHQGKLEDNVLPSDTYDVISAFHSVEHTDDPVRFLEEVSKRIRPGGWLILTFPNIASWEARRMGEKWFHLDPPFHATLPHPEPIVRLLKENHGFGKMMVRSPVFEYAQTWLYAGLRNNQPSRMLLLAGLPLAILGNALLARRHKSGIIEIWARKGAD